MRRGVNLLDSEWNLLWTLNASSQVGAAVFWCWATMALCGHWRPEPSGLDRLGRLLGGAWCTFALFYAFSLPWLLL
jgi:hypothetical protein